MPPSPARTGTGEREREAASEDACDVVLSRGRASLAQDGRGRICQRAGDEGLSDTGDLALGQWRRSTRLVRICATDPKLARYAGIYGNQTPEFTLT